MFRLFESEKQRKERQLQAKVDNTIMKRGAEAFLASVCVPAVEIFGKDKQLWKAAEEMSELVRAISRDRCGQTVDRDNIAEEIADVEIMLFQLKYIFRCNEAVGKWRDKKLVALRKRVDEYRDKQGAKNTAESLQAEKNNNVDCGVSRENMKGEKS